MLYGPRGAPFQNTGELALVLGIPDLMVERALPYLTVYSGQPQIDIFNAAPQVLAAVPGMDPQRLQTILVQREAAPQTPETARGAAGDARSRRRRSRTRKGTSPCG